MEIHKEWEKGYLRILRRGSHQYKKYMNTTKKLIEDSLNQPPEITHEHVRATQLLDLISVTLQRPTNNTSDDDGSQKEQTPFHIYGTIKLVDVEDNNYTYNVFRRRCNNPETILPGTNLLLTVPKESHAYLMVPMASAYKLSFNLKDAATDGKVIAKGDFHLPTLDDKFGICEKVVTNVVPSRNGTYASVQYAILPHGVVATVQLTLTKKHVSGSDQSDSSHAHIYGCISATTKVQQGSIISSVLFDKPSCDPMLVSLGTPIEFGRPRVAVPAYSSLQIKADLWDYHTNQQIASDAIVANLQAMDSTWNGQTCVLGQNYCARVKIFWHNAYDLLEQEKKPLDERQTSQSASSPSIYRWASSSIGSPMVEVFCITVSPDSDVNSDICGKIEVEINNYKSLEGRCNPFVLFDRDESNPASLGGDMKIESLSMNWPLCPLEGESFFIRLCLSDDVGREVCHGYIDWDVFSDKALESWYGKLISSVIRGKHGYATVHYAVFPNAVHAQVEVTFTPKPSTDFQYMIAGNISAWYSSITYSTCSEKKFFRSTLLTEDSPEIVLSNCPIRLDKKAVAVPFNSSLILGMKLEVGVVGRTSEGPWFSKHYGSMDEVVGFDIDMAAEETEKTITGDGFDINVMIKWVEGDEKVKMNHYQNLKNELKRRIQEG